MYHLHVPMRKLRLSEIKCRVHTIILTDHTTSGGRKFVLKSVYSKAFIYCNKNKGEGTDKRGKIAKRGKARIKEVISFLPQQASLRTKCAVWFSSSLLLGISKFSFVRRKQ